MDISVIRNEGIFIKKFFVFAISVFICLVLIIAYMAIKGNKTLDIFELPLLENEETNINSITIRTQMTEKYPMFLVTESKEQIELILAQLKELEFIPIKTDENEKGWQFWFIFHLDDKQIGLSLSATKAYLDGYAYDLKKYDPSLFLELFDSIDTERYRYP